MIQRVLLVIIGLMARPHFCMAGIAYPYPISVKTDKGETYITLCGDEYCKYGFTEDGYAIVQDSDGWYFTSTNEEGNVQKSVYRIEAPEYRSKELRNFLSKQEKGLRPLPIDKYANERKIRRSKTKKLVIGNRKALVVLMQFPDVGFTKTVADFNNLFNQRNYSADGATGSVSDYYSFVSHGQLNLVSDVFGPYTARHEMSYYGQNVGMGGADKNPYALFQEALSFICSQTDLAEYDADGDGYVDNMHIIYAGYGEEAGASSNAIWAHEMTFSEINLGNVRIDRYSCAPELRGRNGSGISRIGPHCHEIGHALGAMDYYDTDYQVGGNYQGTGNWDIMASGSWNDDGVNPANFNPYVRVYDFGWDDEIVIADSKDLSLAPSYERNTLVRINTPVEGEFFLLENRRQVSFDKAVPGEGLLIYHIGSGLSTKCISNSINATFPQECSIVCASSNFSVPTSAPDSYGNINSDGCPFPGSCHKDEFSIDSTPAAICQDGTDAGFSLTAIEEENDMLYFRIHIGNVETGNQNNYAIVGDTIWKDDFNHVVLSNDWKQKTVIGENYWKVGKHIAGTSISYHAKLEYPSDPWSSEDDRILTMLITPEFQQTDNALLLSFDLSTSNTSPSSLSVQIRELGSAEWKLLRNYSAPVGIWKETKLLLEGISSPFEIALCGIVGSGGNIMLDNLVLQKVVIKNTGIIKSHAEGISYTIERGILTLRTPNNKAGRIYIYDLSGRCVFNNVVSLVQIPLKCGIYTIRYGDDIQKVFVP
ncbi:MAG: M6 family metalloprotease domain-containing protein [Bacteroidaceae bacterium]|nr:M6 family metalloprotease domain-containing protein [Bacteroidaceae bacterium]